MRKILHVHDGSTIPSSYFCDGSIDYGNAGWGPDCADGSDEVLATCCDAEAVAYVGLCDGGDDSGDQLMSLIQSQ